MLLTNTALELAPHDREAAKIVAAAQLGVESFFLRMLTAGKQSGDIPEHVDAARVASGLLASLLGLVVLTRSRPSPPCCRLVLTDRRTKWAVLGFRWRVLLAPTGCL